jgi:hypothetical protein
MKLMNITIAIDQLKPCPSDDLMTSKATEKTGMKRRSLKSTCMGYALIYKHNT